MFDLTGKISVVTGGTRGIGLSIVEHYANAGMIVVAIGCDPKRANKVEEEFSKNGFKVFVLKCDIGNVAQITKMVEEVSNKFQYIDVLVNCAGVIDMTQVDELTEEIWDTTLNVNLKGAFFTSQACIPLLKKSVSPRIINISSNAGRMGGYENGLAYTASKGGMISLTYGMARRLGGDGITVNCIAPGTIESDMSKKFDLDARNRLLQRFPLGCFGKVEDVATAACYFASDESRFTTGSVLDINGGMFTG